MVNNNYTIFSSDVSLLNELSIDTTTINWFNFSTGDDYYSNMDERYEVILIDHENKRVVLG